MRSIPLYMLPAPTTIGYSHLGKRTSTVSTNHFWLAVWGVRAWTSAYQFEIYLNQDSLNGLDQA
jgi:hypothetical protein